MRINQLDLKAFGPFSDVSLDLSAGSEGIHIIFGPNEAGKSSALRALRQLLYGIPARSNDNFLHPFPAMRIGGTLHHHGDGRSLRFWRRKGNRNTLLAADGETGLDDAELTGFLSGVSSEVFERMFGIGYEDLTAGGEEIVRGEGALGELLFVAGSGIADLHRIRRDLRTDMETLFLSARASSQQIPKRLKSLKSIRDQLQSSVLDSGDYIRHQRGLEDANRQLEEIDAELRSRSAESSRLKRIEAAFPEVSLLAEKRRELEPFATAPRLDAAFTEKRQQTQEQLQRTQHERDTAQQRSEELRRQLDELEVPEELLASESVIRRFVKRLGNHEKAEDDARSKLRPQRETLETDLQELLTQIRPGASLDEVEQLRITKQQQTRIRELDRRRQSLEAELKKAAQDRDRIAHELQRANASLQETGDVPDLQSLQAAIRFATQQGNLDQQWDRTQAESRRKQEELEIRLAALPQWSGTLEELERLQVPDEATIERFERELTARAGRRETIAQKLAELEEEASELSGEIEERSRRGDVPGLDQLQEIRRLRDRGWSLVRDALEGGTPDEDTLAAFTAEFDAGDQLADAYEQAVVRADSVSDHLRENADAVAKLEGLRNELAKVRDSIERATAEYQEAEAAHDSHLAQWNDLWVRLEIAPLTPAEMRSWRRQQQQLVQDCQETRRLQSEADSLEQQRTEAIDRLLTASREIGEELTSTATLVDLLDEASDIADRLADAGRRQDLLRSQAREAESELPLAETALERASQENKEWETSWQEEMQRLRLPATTLPAEAITYVEQIDDLFAKQNRLEGIRERLTGIREEAEAFQADVREFAQRKSPELAELPMAQCIAELEAELRKAQISRQRRDDLQAELDQAGQTLESAAHELTELTTRIAAMCETAGCERPDELPAIEQRSLQRQLLEDRIDELEEQLTQHSGGRPLEEFIAEVEAEDADTLQLSIDRLREQIAVLGQQRDEVRDRIRDESHALAQMDGRGDAAELAEQRQIILSGLQHQVEQFVPLKLASAVLDRALDRYRERNQGPVLERASELFAALTCNSFARLRADYDENGQAVLVGVRPDATDGIRMDGMSDGTCDQLYLALRLAGLEQYLKQHEPLPFIVDDILVNFDDERAAAALQVLESLSGQTQVIFFTHHQHLIDLAREKLPEESVFVHHLRGERQAVSAG